MAESASTELSAASKLMEQHAINHHVLVEDAPDEDTGKTATGQSITGHEPEAQSTWAESASTKAAGNQKISPAPFAIDTQSHELFPALVGPKPTPNATAAPTWGVKNPTHGTTNGAVTAVNPNSEANTPFGAGTHRPPVVNIPGRNTESMLLEPHHVIPKAQLRQPLPKIIKDLNKRSRATLNMTTLPNGRLKFEAMGPREHAEKALSDLVQQIGSKQSVVIPIPKSARAHIIGKGGSTIKHLQEKTGARIQLPKADEVLNGTDDDDEDGFINVIVEGNAHSAAKAHEAIMKIAGEKAGSINARLRGIPSEFYLFLQNGMVNRLEENNGVQIRVPPHQVWSSQPPTASAPGAAPTFHPAPNDQHVQITGERAAVQVARAEIERQVEELRHQLALEQLSIQRGRHQFIIGDRGVPIDEFFNDTGCAIVLPNDDDDDTVTIIGPPEKLSAGLDKAMDLAMNMQCSNLDISRFHRQAPGGAAAHAGNVTRYLRQRNEIERLEKLYNVHFNTPFSDDGALPWELYSRDGKQAIRAQSEVKGLVESHPPARMSTLFVDPFYHPYLRNDIKPRVREDYRVHLVVPEAADREAPVLLVYEGPESPDAYQIPRAQPSQTEAQEMRKWLQEAQKHLIGLVDKQEEIALAALDVPQKFHERLRRFIRKEQERRDPNQIPVRVSNVGTMVNFRGPCSAVESLASKCEAFVEQEKENEKERGFTLDFDFPQKFANHLIGKGGSNIKELREKYDVDIQIQDGKVELKGPKVKAEAARAHIQALGRQLADETTHILKIEPKFHRELIGAQGGQINRLQSRYKVLIFFPRPSKAGNKDKDDDSVADGASEAGAGKPRRQQAPDEVMIRGPKKGADEARDEILSLLQYLRDNSFTATVPFQQKQLAFLIGQGGSGMDQLRQSTGARIDVPNGRESPDTLVEIQIKGTKAQVAAAKKLLEEKKAVLDNTVIKTIDVDKKHHKALIGVGGSNLRNMIVNAGGSDDRRELARTVQFPKQEADGNTIKIEGRSDIVDKIFEQIQRTVSQWDNQVTDILDVPVEKHRSLIGRGGDVKRGLESQFKVSIDIPRQNSGHTGIRIVGQAADVEKAKAHVQNLVKEQQGETIQVPRALHHFIANNGQLFRKLRNENKVTVDHAGQSIPAKAAPATNTRANGAALPLITDDAKASADAHSWYVVENPLAEEGDIPWVLRGSPEGVEAAKKAIEAALRQAQSQTATGYLFLPDPRTYRHVIGQGGSKVNSIRKQSGCKINVPREQARDEAIEVIGTKEGVEKAKELILAAVQDGVNGIGKSRN